jgi:hypothetical protein
LLLLGTLAVVAVLLVLSTPRGVGAPTAADERQVPRGSSLANSTAPAAAFVPGAAAMERNLLSRRMGDDDDESPVTMHGSARRNNRYNHPKKLHARYIEFRDRTNTLQTPFWLQKLTWKKEPNLERWSQTLKLSFPEGEDDVVTEDEVMSYFTTDDYKPEACIVGHKLPHDPLAHAYVHFDTNEDCKKARKEKDGGAIGKASEVKVVYTDEKKWIRLRDGVQLTGSQRASWMRAYGSQAIPEFSTNWKAESGSRTHPVYPE